MIVSIIIKKRETLPAESETTFVEDHSIPFYIVEHAGPVGVELFRQGIIGRDDNI